MKINGKQQTFMELCLNIKTSLTRSDLNVNGWRPPLATRHIRSVLLINSHHKLNLLSCLLIYLCNK